jgi:hypothetical protein
MKHGVFCNWQPQRSARGPRVRRWRHSKHERPHFAHLTTGLKTQDRHHKHKMRRPAPTAGDVLTKFVDRLPVMPTISPSGNVRGVPLFVLSELDSAGRTTCRPSTC